MGVSPSPFRESVGIPIQQIAATLADGGEMSDHDKEILSNLMDLDAMAENYMPQSSNPVKYHESFNNEWLNSHKKEFVETWLRIGLDNSKSYFKAWLWATRGYWDLQTYSWAVSTSGLGDNTGRNLLYEITGVFFTGGKVTSDYTALRSSSIVSPLFSTAFSVWVTVGATLLRLLKRERRIAVAFMPLIGIWCTLLIAAPFYCEFRYLYPLHLALPIVIISMFLTSKEEKGMNKKAIKKQKDTRKSISSQNAAAKIRI